MQLSRYQESVVEEQANRYGNVVVRRASTPFNAIIVQPMLDDIVMGSALYVPLWCGARIAAPADLVGGIRDQNHQVTA